MQLKRLQALPAWAALQGAEGSEDLWQQLISAIDMQLALTCVVLFFGATAAGLLPLLVTIPEQQVDLASALSAGLLAGAALAVILPEGFESFSKAQAAGGASQVPESAVGAVLLAGFLVMLLLDQLQGGHAHCHPPQHHGHAHVSSSDEELDASEHRNHPVRRPSSSSSHVQLKGRPDDSTRAFIGLLIHSLADGLAIGAAVAGGDEALGATVALAMVLHKAPAALGLTTFLAVSRWPRGDAVRALLLFAAATPVAAVATSGLLSLSPWLSAPGGAALCILFSGGTFLYAACIHVLPRSLSKLQDSRSQPAMQLLFLLTGSVMPLLLSHLFGHGHGHD